MCDSHKTNTLSLFIEPKGVSLFHTPRKDYNPKSSLAPSPALTAKKNRHKKKAPASAASATIGDPGGARTLDPMIKSHLLYQLSYGVIPLGTGAKVMLFGKCANDSSKKISRNINFRKKAAHFMRSEPFTKSSLSPCPTTRRDTASGHAACLLSHPRTRYREAKAPLPAEPDYSCDSGSSKV